ncbi:phosphotransferase enzyme family-domain-containing protein [Daldinia grandis]|nr:phosphotransferase enzyme family-domain-containing protein [Daldinia grandis]
MDVNQEDFDRRLEALQRILQQYSLKSTQVTPIAYVEHCPFHFNNFIYKVELDAPVVPATFPQEQPYTSTPPAEGISTLAIHMSNPLAEGLNNANRVESDGSEIPETVTKFGALTLDDGGAMAGGQSPLLKGGPFDTYVEFWVAKLETQLNEADEGLLLQGWVSGGLWERINKFVGVGGVGMTLTGRPLHPCDEFLSGLWDIGGGIHERNEKLQSNLLSGDFTTQPKGLSAEDVRKWEIAKAWNVAITQVGAIRPSDIIRVERIQALRDWEDLLCPFELANEVMLKRISEEEKAKKKREAEGKIRKWIEDHEL